METHTRPAPRGQRVPPREDPHQPARVNAGAATRRLRTRSYTFPDAMKERGLRSPCAPEPCSGGALLSTTKEAPVSEYDGKQFVGIDLHVRHEAAQREWVHWLEVRLMP